MHGRVTVNFACRCLQDAGFYALCKAEHVDGAHDACLDGLYRVELVMDRACGAGQVENAVHLQKNRFRDIVTDEFKIAVVAQVCNVSHTACKIIVQANDFVTVIQKSFAKVTS